MITVTRVQCLLSEEVRGTPTINPVCAAWLTDNKSNTTGTPLGTSESHHHIHTHVPVLISRMPGTGRERRDEAADVDRDNGRRNTGRVTTR